MLPHINVHRGGQDYRSGGRQKEGSQKIVSLSMNKFRENICRRRSDEQSLNGLRDRNMLDRGIKIRLFGARVP